MWTYNYAGYSDELYHHGTLGMKWGHRKAKASTGRTISSVSSSSSEKRSAANQKKGLSDKQKRALKVGAAVAGTALAVYGAKKLHDYVRTENEKIGEHAASAALKEANNWSSIRGLYELAEGEKRAGHYQEAIKLEENAAKFVSDHAFSKQQKIKNYNFAKAAANVYLNRKQ